MGVREWTVLAVEYEVVYILLWNLNRGVFRVDGHIEIAVDPKGSQVRGEGMGGVKGRRRRRRKLATRYRGYLPGQAQGSRGTLEARHKAT
jgi:hypothetical protein